jgi:hypothetical protein
VYDRSVVKPNHLILSAPLEIRTGLDDRDHDKRLRRTGLFTNKAPEITILPNTAPVKRGLQGHAHRV